MTVVTRLVVTEPAEVFEVTPMAPTPRMCPRLSLEMEIFALPPKGAGAEEFGYIHPNFGQIYSSLGHVHGQG